MGNLVIFDLTFMPGGRDFDSNLLENLKLNDILSFFSCNGGMCLLENETHVANYCTFKMKETNV